MQPSLREDREVTNLLPLSSIRGFISSFDGKHDFSAIRARLRRIESIDVFDRTVSAHVAPCTCVLHEILLGHDRMMRFMKTWHAEHAVVIASQLAIVAISGFGWLQWLIAAAVYASFSHASVSERLREREAIREQPSVECHRWQRAYWIMKEVLWAAFFVATGTWPALGGCAVFLLYPFWRRYWRRIHPLVGT